LAVIESPNSISIDGYGDLYITDQSADLVRQVDPYGIIRTVAGKNYYSSATAGMGAGAAGPVGPAQWHGGGPGRRPFHQRQLERPRP